MTRTQTRLAVLKSICFDGSLQFFSFFGVMFQWGGLSWLHINCSAYFTLTCIWPRSTMTASIATLSTWGFSWGKGLLSARPCRLLRCITCTECKDAAYCYWCSVVCVHVCLLVTTMSCAKTIEILFGMWTWVGPRNHVLVWGARITQGEGAILGCPPPMRLSSKFFDHLINKFLNYGSTLTASCSFLGCWPDGPELSQWAAQTVLDVYLKLTCSHDTGACSASGVVNSNVLYESTHSLTESPLECLYNRPL